MRARVLGHSADFIAGLQLVPCLECGGKILAQGGAGAVLKNKDNLFCIAAFVAGYAFHGAGLGGIHTAVPAGGVGAQIHTGEAAAAFHGAAVASKPCAAAKQIALAASIAVAMATVGYSWNCHTTQHGGAQQPKADFFMNVFHGNTRPFCILQISKKLKNKELSLASF